MIKINKCAIDEHITRLAGIVLFREAFEFLFIFYIFLALGHNWSCNLFVVLFKNTFLFKYSGYLSFHMSAHHGIYSVYKIQLNWIFFQKFFWVSKRDFNDISIEHSLRYSIKASH